ncbi:MAG: pitrilysin family protein [Gemmatimonadota bacterium]|nr:pitrilysin family protein [Gemmatimonadota bacterium]MDQ8155188.1 pitrilysin family protein [Gemmatimonadota bacterium]MDQ8156605.1 pitrilysin family protein [Gemmatimonadota bacterium]
MSRVHTPHHLAVAVLSTIAALSAPTTSTAQPTTQAFDRTRPPALGAAPTLTVPRVQSGTLANGPVIRLVEQRELPLVQIILSVAGGARLDRDDPGLVSFLANLLDEGAGARDANALQGELAFLGASLSTGASWDATTISLKVSRRNLDAALDLMADVVLRPTFAATEVNRQRDLRLAALLQQRDQPAALAGLAVAQTLFPEGHPYRRSASGDSTATTRLDSAAVRAAYQGAIRPERAAFYVVGDITLDEARTALERRFGAWRATGEERRPAPVLVSTQRASGVRLILVDKPGAAQSVINVVAPGVERTTGDHAAIEVMNTILGGSFSSRLNTLLRETKGYTYGISSGFAYRPLPGPFTVSTAVRTDVTDSSLVDIFRELRTIRDTPVSDAELDRAKAYLGLAVPGDLETVGQVASEVATLALWNLPIDYLTEYVQRVGQVSAADVQRVARAFVPAEHAWVIVVGDLAKIRAPIERLGLGTVTVREVGSLTR